MLSVELSLGLRVLFLEFRSRLAIAGKSCYFEQFFLEFVPDIDVEDPGDVRHHYHCLFGAPSAAARR